MFCGKTIYAVAEVQAGSRIIMMPGAGINELNLHQIASETGAHQFHSTAKKFFEYGLDPVINKPYSSFETAAEQVIKLKKILSNSN